MQVLTNQEFTYRQTPATEEGTGTFDSIKGNTLVWNQLNDLSSYATNTSNGVTFTKNSDNSISITGTATGRVSSTNFPRFAIKNGHKYLLLLSKELTGIYFRSTVGVTASIQQSAIFTATADGNGYFYFDTNATSTATLNITNLFVNIIDLTLMFGTGNEPTTVDGFTSLFPLSYYPYDIGSLLSFNGSGIKTVGKNQSQLVSMSTVSGGYINSATGNIAEVKQGATYTLSFDNLTSSSANLIVRMQVNGSWVNQVQKNLVPNSRWFATFTATNDGTISLSAGLGSQYSQVKVFDNIQLEFGSTATSYETYEDSITTLPTLTYFPTGMKSAGSVYDELTPSKAITRVGAVDLGTLTWNKGSALNDGSGTGYYTTLNPYPSAFKGAEANIVSSKFIGVPYRSSWESISNGQMFEITNGRLVVGADSSYADGNAFKTAMNGVYLYYELATPTETDVDLDLTYPIEVGGTEEILPSALSNGVVDLGTQYWREYTDVTTRKIYYAAISGMDSTSAQLICDGLTAVPWGSLPSMAEKTIQAHPSLNIVYACDSSCEDATEFTSAMSGVMLWYEKSDNSPSTTPIEADMTYRGLIPVSVNVYPLGSGTVTGSGQYRYREEVTITATPNDEIYRFLRYEDENGDTLSTNSTYTFKVGD